VLLLKGGLSEPAEVIETIPASDSRRSESTSSDKATASEPPSAEITVASSPASGTGAAEGEAVGRLRVQVVTLEGGAALAGARVEAWELAAGESDAELPLVGLAHSAGITDAEGRVVLDPPVKGGALRLVASAPGHRVGQARFDAPPVGEIHLALRAGLAIEGLLVDPRGEPTGGVEVRARHSDRPAALTQRSSSAAALLEGVEAAWARSAPDGSFRLEGLSPGTYRVEVTEDGWVLDAPDGVPARGTHPWTTYTLAKAGSTSLRLVVVPLRSVRLEPLDSVTGELILGAPWTLEAVAADLAAPASASSYAPSAHGVEEAAWPSVFLRLDRSPPPGAEAEISLVVEGHEPYRGRALLRLPGDAAATTVSLVRLEPVGEARLAIRLLPRGAAPAAGRAEMRATICRREDHLLVRRALARQPDGTFTCADLPVGDADVRVWDGASASEPQRVTLEAGKETLLSVALPAPTGATIVLRDLRGRRIYDADSLVFAAPGEAHGMADRASATRLFPGERRPLDVVVPLAPGTYRWAVNKLGVGYATGTVTVTPGAVARIDARLDPEALARALRARTPSPR